MKSLNSLEISILNKGIDSIYTCLRAQIPYLEVEKREATGVGIFTEFSSLKSPLRIEEKDFEITDIEGSTPELKNGFGCIIFVKSGQIATIECFTYDEAWPNAMSSYEIKRES